MTEGRGHATRCKIQNWATINCNLLHSPQTQEILLKKHFYTPEKQKKIVKIRITFALNQTIKCVLYLFLYACNDFSRLPSERASKQSKAKAAVRSFLQPAELPVSCFSLLLHPCCHSLPFLLQLQLFPSFFLLYIARKEETEKEVLNIKRKPFVHSSGREQGRSVLSCTHGGRGVVALRISTFWTCDVVVEGGRTWRNEERKGTKSGSESGRRFLCGGDWSRMDHRPQRMPLRGRKNNNNSTSSRHRHLRSRHHEEDEASANYSSSEELGAPKVKDSRLSDSRCGSPNVMDVTTSTASTSGPPKLSVMTNSSQHSPNRASPTRRQQSPNKSKITDYFTSSSPSAGSPSSSSGPPVLLPQISPPSPSSSSKPSDDQASDRSGGDSGKENEEESASICGCETTKPAVPGQRGGAGRSKSPAKTAGGSGEQCRVVTRSQRASKPSTSGGASSSSTSSSSLKKPLSISTNTRSGGGQFNTPPSSPVKSSSSGPPQSPPTPHKIKLLNGGEAETASASSASSSAASTALQKLKRISFSPKKKESTTTTASKQAVVSKKAVSPDRVAIRHLAVDIGPKKSLATDVTSSAKPSSRRSKLAKAAANNHKVTDFFPGRKRSERLQKKTLELEQLQDVEAQLLSDRDDTLDLAVVHFADKGRGVVARRPFDKGEFVVEYAGDLIDVGVAEQRESKYSLDLSTGCYMYYFKHQEKQYCIDATGESGRFGRLVNHSRTNPNLQTKVIMVRDEPRLILVAKRAIEEDEELLYDYGDRCKETIKAHPWLAL